MPGLGRDHQYDESFEEQDKIRRRLELKQRLKVEGIRKRYDPFLQMKGILFSDPSIDRYSELRKRGRTPGSPMKASLFFGMMGFVTVPVYLLSLLYTWKRDPYLEKVASGEISYAEKPFRGIV